MPTLSTTALSGHSGPLSSHGSSGINLSSFLTGSSSVLEPSSSLSSSSSSSLLRDSHHTSGAIGSASLVNSNSSRTSVLSGSHGVGGVGVGGGGSSAIGSATGGAVAGGIPGSVGEIHPLHFNWVFWFMHRAPGSRILNYESSMKKIATFGSVRADSQSTSFDVLWNQEATHVN